MAGSLMLWSQAEYFAASAFLSRSELEVFRKSPELYYGTYVEQRWPRPEPNDAMEFGSVFHGRYLLGKPLEELACLIPEAVLSANGARAGAAWKQFKAECDEAGLLPLTIAMWDTLRGMLASLEEHPAALAIFADQGYVEAPLAWVHEPTELPCRSLLDKVCVNGRLPLISDLKSAASVEFEEVSRKIYDYGLHRQAAFYTAAVEAVWDVTLPFAFLFVEKCPPYRVEVIELEPEFLDLGSRENDEALEAMLRCIDTGVWKTPGWSDAKLIPMPYRARKGEMRYEPSNDD